MRQTNQLNQNQKQFSKIFIIIQFLEYISLVRWMWRSIFVPETIFKRASDVLSVLGRRIERVGRSKSENLTDPNVEVFMNLAH